MTTVLAIDPGPVESGWALIDTETCEPIDFGKIENIALLPRIWSKSPDHAIKADAAVIEMVASYGMAVGKDVFETCVWIGRIYSALELAGVDTERIYRRDVKLHVCGQTKAKDSNIRQALVDRFAPGVRNHGKGTKAEPGFFYGFKADVWQAMALAVYAADKIEGRKGVAS